MKQKISTLTNWINTIDRKKQAETHEAHRGQMAAHLDSIKQDSVKASVALEGLVTDKARWEADLAALRTSMQDMECDRGEPSVGGFYHLAQLVGTLDIELMYGLFIWRS
jgi:hypothetical protein